MLSGDPGAEPGPVLGLPAAVSGAGMVPGVARGVGTDEGPRSQPLTVAAQTNTAHRESHFMVILQCLSNEVSCYAAVGRPKATPLHSSYLLAFAERGAKPVFVQVHNLHAVGRVWQKGARQGWRRDFGKNPGKM